MTQFRRWQRGSVVKRGSKTKIWVGIFREDVVGPDGTITRKQKRVPLGTVREIPTRYAAMNKLREILEQPVKKAGISFAELVTRWQAAVVPSLKTSTADVYNNAIRLYLLPAFGDKDISTINREAVELFLAKQARTYCRSTLGIMRVALLKLFGWALSNELVEKNVVSRVKLPKAGKRIQRAVLTPEQVRALASKLREPYATLVLFLAITGLRISEALAVQHSDIRGNMLHVSRRVYHGTIDSLKTDNSERVLPLPDSLLSRIRTLPRRGNWIFGSRQGTPLNPSNVLRRNVQPRARELGIQLGGFHDFRHTLATDLITSGLDVKSVASILGHADTRTTLNVYTHPKAEQFRAPLNQVAEQLLPKL